MPTILIRALTLCILFCTLASCGSGNKIVPASANVTIREAPVSMRRFFDVAFFEGGAPVVVRDDWKKLRYVIEQFDDTLALQWQTSLPYNRLYPFTPFLIAHGTKGVLLLQSQKFTGDSAIIAGRIFDNRTGKEELFQEVRTYMGKWENDGNYMRGVRTSKDSLWIALFDLSWKKNKETKTTDFLLDITSFDNNLENRIDASFSLPFGKGIEKREDLAILDLILGRESEFYITAYDKDSTLYVHRCDLRDKSVRTITVSLKERMASAKDTWIENSLLLENGDGGVLSVASLANVHDGLYGILTVAADFSDRKKPTAALHIIAQPKGHLFDYHLASVMRFPSDTLVLTFEEFVAKPKSMGNGVSYNYYGILFLAIDPAGKSLWNYLRYRPRFQTDREWSQTHMLASDRDSIHLFYRSDPSTFSLNSISRKSNTPGTEYPFLFTERNVLHDCAIWPAPGRCYMVLGEGNDASLVHITY